MTEDSEPLRNIVNARMRRIDLFCKLIGPLLISLVDGASTAAALCAVFAMNCVAVPFEYIYIAKVSHQYIVRCFLGF